MWIRQHGLLAPLRLCGAPGQGTSVWQLRPGPRRDASRCRDAGSYGYKAVQRWTKPAKLKLAGQPFKSVLDYHRLVVPINLHDTHWTCAVIDLKAQELLYFDSMSVRPRAARCAAASEQLPAAACCM